MRPGTLVPMGLLIVHLDRASGESGSTPLSLEKVAETFDGDRLRQARQLDLRTKQDVASTIGVSAAAVGQYEANAMAPRPELVGALASALDVLPEFFAAGRPQS